MCAAAHGEADITTLTTETSLPMTAVICARNRASTIADCVASVLAARPARVLLIDGQSSDATAANARAAGADVASDEGAGLGAARRLGAQLSDTEWIAYVDSDAVIGADTLERLLQVALREGYDAVQARLDPAGTQLTYWQRGEIWRRRIQERPGPAHIIGCQATLVRRSLLITIPFDASFRGAAEDHDWCFRATAAGARLAHTAEASAVHEDRATFAEFARQRFWYGRGMTRLLIRHRRLAPQVRAASRGIWRTPQYAPFMAMSWAITALGMTFEVPYLTVLRRDILRRLRDGGPLTFPNASR